MYKYLWIYIKKSHFISVHWMLLFITCIHVRECCWYGHVYVFGSSIKASYMNHLNLMKSVKCSDFFFFFIFPFLRKFLTKVIWFYSVRNSWLSCTEKIVRCSHSLILISWRLYFIKNCGDKKKLCKLNRHELKWLKLSFHSNAHISCTAHLEHNLFTTHEHLHLLR